MGYLPTAGFTVRKPFWHGLGEQLDEYPGREVGMQKAGHDFKVIERPFFLGEFEEVKGGPQDGAKVAVLSSGDEEDEEGPIEVKGWKALLRDDTEKILHVAKDSYTVVQNETGWDIVDALVGEGAKYETGITLRDGAVCAVCAWLDEPVYIPGDTSVILPWLVANWTHDGSGSFHVRSTNIRAECENTLSAGEAQGARLGTDYTFRHSKNVMSRIEEAKKAVTGTREGLAEYVKIMEGLAKLPVTKGQRETFVQQFIPMPHRGEISERVAGNIEEDRRSLRALFDGPTVPEAHEFTGYGLQLAGVEFLDHVRGARTAESKFGRSLLRSEPRKQQLTKLIREVAKS